MEKIIKKFALQPAKLTIKEDVGIGIIEAYVSVFGNIDSYGDVIEQGAFKDSLAKKLPKGVWMHNWDEPIAKTLEAREDPHGLFIKGQLILDVQKAKEAYILMKEGVIDEFSIGFYINEAEWEEREGVDVRVIKKATILEWSPVLAGANPDTELVNIKSEKKDDKPAEVENDDDKEEVVEEVVEDKSVEEKVGKVLSAKNVALVKGTIDALTDLSDTIKQTITPLNELLKATKADDSGEKVVPTSLLRIRRTIKQIDRQAGFLLRITK